MSLLHQASRVVTQLFSNADVLFTDLIHLIAISPDLIRSPRCSRLSWWFRFPVAMKAHDRAEASPLEPSREEFAERRVLGATTVKSTYITGPKSNASKALQQADF